MGNNVSSVEPNNVSTSPTSGSGRLSIGHTHRTHSLPIPHHFRLQHSHRDHETNRHRHAHSDHPNRRHTVTTNGSISPNDGRHSSSRLRQALPNFVSNVSTAIGHKLQWSSKNRKRSQKSCGGHHRHQCRFGTGVTKLEKRSRSKTREHCRLFRELISNWKLSDLHCLVVEFEAALSLRELQKKADSARPPASSLKDDFSRLYRCVNAGQDTPCDDSSADGFVVLDGRTFAVHRAFLSRRCPFFRLLFSNGTDSWSGANASSVFYNGSWRPTVPVTFPPSVTPLSGSAFGLLLEYLNTGELSSTNANREEVQALMRFYEEQNQLVRDTTGRCGGNDWNWTTLEDDVAAMMKELNESKSGGDTLLIFINSRPASLPVSSMDGGVDFGESVEETFCEVPMLATLERQKARSCQFMCHNVVLAARSPFFRAIIRKRRLQDKRESNDTQSPGQDSLSFSPWRKASRTTSSGLLEIVLDESVIPRQYAPVLLHTMYTDEVDLSLVMRDCVASAASCLTEVQAIAAGKCQSSPIDEATDIYQIARFLEFDKLAQGCEDAIISYVSLETLSAVYNWSKESHGSAYVRRYCVEYLCQEFSRFGTSTLLLDMDESMLVEALKSDYVQASELDILNAVIRWGEHQLVRRLEEREPNILVGTTHSISRKGVKRADLSDEELKEILTDLLPLIRVDYILPPQHAALESAIARGLISTPPADLLPVSEVPNVLLPPSVAARRHSRKRSGAIRHSPSMLVRSCSTVSASVDDSDMSYAAAQASQGRWSQPHRNSAGPRLFLPYLDEANALLEKRVAESPDQLSALINHHPPVQAVLGHHFMMQRSSSSGGNRFPDALYMVDNAPRSGVYNDSDDLDTAELTLPPPATLQLLKERIERMLQTSSTVRRALACGCNYHRSNVLKQVRLRALREFGLADSTLALLENCNSFVGDLSTRFSLPSFCSSVAGDTECQDFYVDNYVEDDLLAANVSASTKRRFRSQPELAQFQCDLIGGTPVAMEWPDLMTMTTTSSFDCESTSLMNRRAVSSTSVPLDLSPDGSMPVNWMPATSPSLAVASSERSSESTKGKENLRQQFVDLTQQICDLVLLSEDDDRVRNRSTREIDDKGRFHSLPSTSMTPDKHHRKDTAV